MRSSLASSCHADERQVLPVVSVLLPVVLSLMSARVLAVDLVGEPEVLEDIQVEANAPPLDRLPLGQPRVLLKGDALTQKTMDTLGATLEQEQGLNNASFGPGVGQPVVRGQGGPRVQVMQDGLNLMDASQFSGDHANAIEPLLAEEIEVLKGPSTLLYGGTAIGGAVNVIDRRVPYVMPSAPFTGAFSTRYNSVSNETASVMKVDAGQDHVALHLDGFYRQNGNLQIPGYAINDAAYAQMNGGALPQINTFGYVGNTQGNAIGGTVGLSWVDDWGYSGASYNNRNDYYGVPLDGSSGSPKVAIAQNVSRSTFKTEWLSPLDLFSKATLRFAYNDYTHFELDNQVLNTTFTNQGYDSRIEIDQMPIGAWSGKFGLQTQNNMFNVIAAPGTMPAGAPLLAPLTAIQNYGLFTLQRWNHDAFTTEAGFRVEMDALTPAAGEAPSRSYLPVSASLAERWQINEKNELKLAFSRSQRSPQVQELYFDGYHDATNSIEIGNSGLGMETSYNLDLGYALKSDYGNLDLSVFQNWFQNYIYLYDTGLNADPNLYPYDQCPSSSSGCVSVYRYAQQNAVFRGYEANYKVPIQQDWVPGGVILELFSDFTRGQFTQGAGNVPRMPPLRYGFQLNYEIERWGFTNRLTRADPQNDPGVNQTATPGYMLWNVSGQYHLTVEGHDVMLFARGNNLLDQTIRSSVSYLRVYAPQAGRGGEIGIQITF
jgi:iron complex outermembrane recepter protein